MASTSALTSGVSVLSCLLLLCAAASIQASAGKCPDIDCDEGVYKFVFFATKDASDLTVPDLGPRLLTQKSQSATIPGQLTGRSNVLLILATLGGTPVRNCFKFCKDYNTNAAAAGGVRAAYWTFWLRYVKATRKADATCLCYAPQVCAAGDAPIYKECPSPIESGGKVSLFITGRLCGSGVVGDPHFTGADKSSFEFTGLPNHHYALLSDRDMQVNAFFGGRYAAPSTPGQPGKAMTWMRKIGIVYHGHTIVMEAREGPEWQYGGGYMQRILVDNHPVTIDSVGESVDFSFVGGAEMKLTWLLAEEPSADDFVDKYEVSLGKQLTVVLTLRPEVSTHRTPEDGLVHFSVHFANAKLSADVHGVLGQTYRRDFAGRLEQQKLVWSKLLKREVVAAENGKGFLDGNPEDYLVSTLLSTECELCSFRSQGESSRKMLM